MLGKLFKHEFKDTGKVLLPLNLVLIGLTLVGMIIIGLKVFDTENIAVGIMLAAMILFYIFGIFALFIVTYIYLMMRFYRSMYSAEGYLTHTLPVSSFAILNTKILVSVFWAFISMVLTICSVFALILTGLKTAGESVDLQAIARFMEVEMNYPLPNMIGRALFFMVLSSFSGLLMIYCCISVGQLFNKHKILASFLTYGVIYIILQVVNTVLMFGRALDSTTIYENQYGYATVPSSFAGIFNSSMIQSIILIAVYYGVTAFISNKKLNLD